MVKTYKEIGIRAKGTITRHLAKLMEKYGEREVRLVVLRILDNASKKRNIEKEIERQENQLRKLKRGHC